MKKVVVVRGRPSRQHRGADDDDRSTDSLAASRRRSLASLVRCPAAAIRSPAAARSCRRTSRSIGVPLFVNNTSRVRRREAHHREGPVGAHRPGQVQGRAGHDRRRRRPGWEKSRRSRSRRRRFTRDAAGVALRPHLDGEDRVQGRQGRQGAVVEPVDAVPRGVRRHEQHAGSTDASAFLGQDVNALDRLAAEFARTVVSAILEAF